jgi:hypothetical protein
MIRCFYHKAETVNFFNIKHANLPPAQLVTEERRALSAVGSLRGLDVPHYQGDL